MNPHRTRISWASAAGRVLCCAGAASALFSGGGWSSAQEPEDNSAPGHELRSNHVTVTPEVEKKLDELAAEVRKNPDDALKLSQYGWALTKIGRMDEGLAALTRASTIAPEEPKVQLYVARGLWKAKQIDEAADAAEKVTRSPLASSKDAAESFRVLGAVRWEQGRARDAETAYREGLKRDPGNAALLSTLGLLLRGARRNGEATALLEEAVRKRPKDIQVLRIAAQQMESMARLERAKELWEQIADLIPDDPDAAFIAANAEWRLEEYDKIVARLSRSLKIKPNDASAQLMYAQALLRLKRYDESRRAAEVAQKLGDPRAVETLDAIELERRQGDKR